MITVNLLDVFNFIAGVCSIVSLIIALRTYNKVTNIENQYNKVKVNVKQKQSGKRNIQAGRDYNSNDNDESNFDKNEVPSNDC